MSQSNSNFEKVRSNRQRRTWEEVQQANSRRKDKEARREKANPVV